MNLQTILSKSSLALGILTLCILFSACGSTVSPTATTVKQSPISSPTAFESPLEGEPKSQLATLDTHRFYTAKESFTIAYQTAQAEYQDIEWYGLVPFTSMIRFFALPIATDTPSWFFRFRTPEGKDYIVEVLEGEVIGTNELEFPTYIEPSLDDLEPLGSEWPGIGDNELLERYLEEENSLLVQSPNVVLAYRLSHLVGQPDPVWTLYNADNVAEPIFRINALTGDPIPLE